MRTFASIRLAHALTLSGLIFSFDGVLAQEKSSAATGAGPSAASVIAKYVEAIGGKDAIMKHSSVALKGKWEIPTMSQSGDLELVKAKPNRQVIHVKIGDQGEIVTGYDGTVGWMLNPFTGPMLLEGKLLDQTRDEADFYNSFVRDAANYKSMETVGQAKMDNKDCIELKLVTKSGRESREFFDAKTGLLVATKGVQESAQGPNEVTVIFSDYKKTGDVMQPSKLQIKAGEFDQVVTITTVEFDKVADKEFELPTEVKALLKK
jgi:hypothetical protein